MHTDRRTFITAVALGAPFLAGCASDPATIEPATVGPVAPLLPSVSWWLDGNSAPVGGDLGATNLRISGQVSAALSGTLVRNGSNPAGESAHWFFGNGMVHGRRVRDGKAGWCRVEPSRRRTCSTPRTPGLLAVLSATRT